MSRPQRPEVLTVSAFLQRVQEARAKHPSGTFLCYEHLEITNDNDPTIEKKPLDLRGLHLRNVDFRRLNAEGALFRETVAYRCNFQESNWSNAQGNFQIYSSNVSEANFTGAERFLFVDSYARGHCFPEGLTTEQTQSITPVSYYTSILLDTCGDHHVNYIIEEQKRISGLEEKLAALAEQVAQLSQRQQ